MALFDEVPDPSRSSRRGVLKRTAGMRRRIQNILRGEEDPETEPVEPQGAPAPEPEPAPMVAPQEPAPAADAQAAEPTDDAPAAEAGAMGAVRPETLAGAEKMTWDGAGGYKYKYTPKEGGGGSIEVTYPDNGLVVTINDPADPAYRAIMEEGLALGMRLPPAAKPVAPEPTAEAEAAESTMDDRLAEALADIPETMSAPAAPETMPAEFAKEPDPGAEATAPEPEMAGPGGSEIRGGVRRRTVAPGTGEAATEEQLREAMASSRPGLKTLTGPSRAVMELYTRLPLEDQKRLRNEMLQWGSENQPWEYEKEAPWRSDRSPTNNAIDQAFLETPGEPGFQEKYGRGLGRPDLTRPAPRPEPAEPAEPARLEPAQVQEYVDYINRNPGRSRKAIFDDIRSEAGEGGYDQVVEALGLR